MGMRVSEEPRARGERDLGDVEGEEARDVVLVRGFDRLLRLDDFEVVGDAVVKAILRLGEGALGKSLVGLGNPHACLGSLGVEHRDADVIGDAALEVLVLGAALGKVRLGLVDVRPDAATGEDGYVELRAGFVHAVVVRWVYAGGTVVALERQGGEALRVLGFDAKLRGGYGLFQAGDVGRVFGAWVASVLSSGSGE